METTDWWHRPASHGLSPSQSHSPRHSVMGTIDWWDRPIHRRESPIEPTYRSNAQGKLSIGGTGRPPADYPLPSPTAPGTA